MTWSVPRMPIYLDTAVCTDRPRLGHIYRSGSERIWHAFDEANQSDPDLQKDSNLRAVQLQLGHTKMDSTVRYPGVELEDALAIAEAIKI